MLTGESGSWADVRNRLLALALTQHEATLCSGCGMSLIDTTDDDVKLSADSRICRGCSMLHDAHGEHDEAGTQYYLEIMEKRAKAPEAPQE